MGIPRLVADRGAGAAGRAGARGRVVAASLVAGELAAGDEGRAAAGRPGQTGDAAHVAAFLRDASARRRDGHSHGARFTRPSQRRDDADLHARDAEAGDRGAESAGWLIFEAALAKPRIEPGNGDQGISAKG